MNNFVRVTFVCMKVPAPPPREMVFICAFFIWKLTIKNRLNLFWVIENIYDIHEAYNEDQHDLKFFLSDSMLKLINVKIIVTKLKRWNEKCYIWWLSSNFIEIKAYRVRNVGEGAFIDDCKYGEAWKAWFIWVGSVPGTKGWVGWLANFLFIQHSVGGKASIFILRAREIWCRVECNITRLDVNMISLKYDQ